LSDAAFRAALTPRTLACLLMPPMLWAGNAVVGRWMVGQMAPVAMNALRWALVALILLPLTHGLWRQRRAIAARWPHLLGLGVLGVGSYNALQYLALQTSSPMSVTLIGASVPIWMMLVGRVWHGQVIHARQWLGALVSISGVVLVIAQGQWALLMALHTAPGDWLMVLASLLWAVYSWMLARPPAHMQGAERPDWDWAMFLQIQVGFGLVWAVACTGMEAGWSEATSDAAAASVWWPHTTAAWLALLFIAVGPSILAYRFWGQAVAAVGPTMAAFFGNLTPLFAALWSAMFLGQSPSWYHPVGLLLVMAGIAVSASASARRA
jgi:drug/metabolite transporter (DMT)-like permease